ncbi:MAG: hypothetical protein WAK33_20760 [Silvibacterium sp.]
MPNVYCYLRTDPEKVIGRELVDDFVKHLAAFCATELAGAAPLSPWLTLHLNGMRHEVHNDSENGTYGYVYSLTIFDGYLHGRGDVRCAQASL